MIEGVMIFYSIGRAHEYVFFKSGLPTFQYAFVTYSLTAVFYIASLTLSGFQMTGGKTLPETHGRTNRQTDRGSLTMVGKSLKKPVSKAKV